MTNSLPKLGLATAAAVFCGLVSTSVMAQAPAPAAPPATPRLADGHPDLNGIWGGGVAQLTPTACQKSVDAFANDAVDRFAAGGAKGGAKWIAFEQDCGPQHRGHVSVPMYKPQYWQAVRDHDFFANFGGDKMDFADPSWLNYPDGVPRMGAPNKILQTSDHVTFLYESGNRFRSIPTDCRPFDPVLQYDQTFMGLAVGCWEGDKLVVTSVGFTDKTWLDWPGYFHTADMKVIETFERQGDRLLYNVTVEDPDVLMQPYKLDQAALNLNKDPKTELMQDVPYNDRALGALIDPGFRG